MANYPKNMSLKTATGKKNKFNLDKQVVTTTDFGIMKPIECFPMVPGDEFNLQYSQFTRLMPMPVPTFGDIRSKVRGFFVPNRLLDPNWLPFISNNMVGGTDNTLKSPITKKINALSIVLMFVMDHTGKFATNDFATLVGTGNTTSSTTEPWDFVISYVPETTYYFYRFTPRGRRVYDFLQSLHIGFTLPTRLDIFYSNLVKFERIGNISPAPLLAFVKLYLDWIVPSRFVLNHAEQEFAISCNSTDFENQYYIRYSSTTSDLLSVANGSRAERLRQVFSPLYCFYENDYFTSSWQSPYGDEVDRPYLTEVSGFDSNISEPAHGEVLVESPSGTPTLGMKSTDGSTALVSQFGLLALGALQDMVNRGKLAGSKVQDYLLATYGIKPSDAALNISSYLGCHTDTIKIGDVMATAGTEQNSLGQFGGKGIGYSSNAFKYKAEEHGYFIVTHELAVKPSYIDGMMPMFKQLDRLDFFQPEFDSLGCDAVPIREFNCDFNEGAAVNVNSIFGFVPRYARLKVNHDVVSGDFRVKSLNSGLDSWYLSRKFPPADSALYKLINEQFCLSTTDSPLQNLDYIFNDSTNDADHFYMIFVCRNTAFRPMLSLSDALLNNEHNKLGKDIQRPTNGNVQ